MYTRFAFVLSLALCASSVATSAEADAFLKLDGIPGSSTDKVFKDELVVDAYSFGVSTPGTSTTSGAAVGKAVYEQLTFTHAFDRASQQLFNAISLGRAIKSAVLTVRRPGSQDGYLKIWLNNVFVTDIKVSGGDSDVAREQVTLRYQKIAFEYFAQQPDGRLLSTGKTQFWDIAAYKYVTE